MKNWRVTYEKVVEEIALNEKDWRLLRQLVRKRRFLRNKKKRWLMDEMLTILFTADVEQTDEVMQATQLSICLDYIPLVLYVQDKDHARTVMLMDRE